MHAAVGAGAFSGHAVGSTDAGYLILAVEGHRYVRVEAPTGQVLEQRLLNLNLTDVYMYNADPGNDFNNHQFSYQLKDYNSFFQ